MVFFTTYSSYYLLLTYYPLLSFVGLVTLFLFFLLLLFFFFLPFFLLSSSSLFESYFTVFFRDLIVVLGLLACFVCFTGLAGLVFTCVCLWSLRWKESLLLLIMAV
jgi:hypothetical protein